MNNEFDNKPKSIDLIGKDVFIKVPFYKRNDLDNVIYINPKLYEKIFNKKYNYNIAKEDILNKFAVTLKGNGKVDGYGYVDKQIDPTDIALNGNKGSGRAFYLYENCNIKGEKTLFATSPRDDYNNGKYSLDCAIEESLISNILNNSDFNTFLVLAIIDTNTKYQFPHTSELLPCGLMIRYSMNKELYRFSHRFVNNIPFNKNELIDISNKIGEMEGLKFIKRLLHGAWSIGNLSIDSNMIDLDTSFFVKGRHPQWSFTDKYITNYFGYEYYGQIKVLETILNSNLNIDNVELNELENIIINSRKNKIREEFPKLIGYDNNIYLKYKENFDLLADSFEYLSKLIYDNYDNLNCIDINCNNTYLFDFSRFFRYYEISKQKDNYKIEHALKLLINENSEILKYNYDEEKYHDKITSFFENIIINDEEKYLEVLNKVILFIKELDKLNEKIEKENIIDKNLKLIKSYIENEDKSYLFARKWIRAELISLYNEKGPKITNDIMNYIINFYSNKDYNNNSFDCDLFIFKTGILYRTINKDGFNKIKIKLFEQYTDNKINLIINNNKIELKSDDLISFESDNLLNIDLEYLKIDQIITENILLEEINREKTKIL